MCDPKGKYRVILGTSGGYGCSPSFRRFITTKEELECLENYQEQLKKELEAVAEHIKRTESKS